MIILLSTLCRRAKGDFKSYKLTNLTESVRFANTFIEINCKRVHHILNFFEVANFSLHKMCIINTQITNFYMLSCRFNAKIACWCLRFIAFILKSFSKYTVNFLYHINLLNSYCLWAKNQHQNIINRFVCRHVQLPVCAFFIVRKFLDFIFVGLEIK